jgi:hypothetical protein
MAFSFGSDLVSFWPPTYLLKIAHDVICPNRYHYVRSSLSECLSDQLTQYYRPAFSYFVLGPNGYVLSDLLVDELTMVGIAAGWDFPLVMNKGRTDQTYRMTDHVDIIELIVSYLTYPSLIIDETRGILCRDDEFKCAKSSNPMLGYR